MRHYDCPLSFDLSNPTSQICDKFVEGTKLGFGRLIAIQVPYEADADRDIVEVVAGHMPAVDLFCPARTYFNFTITRRSSVADDKMVGHSMLHLANPAMISVENAGVALPGSAVVNDDIFPSAFFDSCAVDRPAHPGSKVSPALEPAARTFRGRLETLIFLQT